MRRLAKVALPVMLTAIIAACASQHPKVASSAPAPIATPAPKAAQMAQPVAPKPVATNSLRDPNSILSKRSVYYDYDAYAVKTEFRPMIEAHAAYVKVHPGSSVVVEGNCDERGSREYNLALGQRRADGVKKMMVLLGAPEGQVDTASFGEEKPRASGHDEISWAQNRRSDIVYKKEQ